jgi:hypothetical protein
VRIDRDSRAPLTRPSVSSVADDPHEPIDDRIDPHAQFREDAVQ